jgi:hypothetical protein
MKLRRAPLARSLARSLDRSLAAAALGAALLGAPTPARANGRPPLTNGITFRPNDNQSLYVRSTFGLLISHDAGCSFRWVCEQAIGYGGVYDPKYAVAADGTIFATTFNGLKVSRDGGCSFTTATAELPPGAPGRIADTWVDALGIGPTGEIWAATADGTKPNDIYRSTDGGVTFAPRGMQSPVIWWKSLVVAPSDAARVYVSGYQMTDPSPQAHVFSTTNGGQSWAPSPLTGVQLATTPLVLIAAVDPANPLIVYLVSVDANGPGADRLYRSTDGAATFTEVLVAPQSISNVVIRDATTVVVATATASASAGGAFQSTDGGATFTAVAGAPRLGCLGKSPDGSLIGCGANWDPDFKAVARFTDAQWKKVFRFVELAGPLACPAGTPGHDMCDQELWPTLKAQFAATGPVDPACAIPPGDTTEPPKEPVGCCDAGTGSPLGAGLLAGLLACLLGRRRARR